MAAVYTRAILKAVCTGAILKAIYCGAIMKALGNIQPDDVQPFDLTMADVVDRTNFRRTPLFISYCENTFQKCMALAKKQLAATGACEDELKLASEIRPLSQGSVYTAKLALRLFHYPKPEPKSELMQVILNDLDHNVKFLQDFAPDHTLTLASCMMTDLTNVSPWSLNAFFRGAQY